MKPIVLKLSDNVTIINGDCRDVLPVECDAVVTDPPYQLEMGGGGIGAKRKYISEIRGFTDGGFDVSVLSGFDNWTVFCGVRQLREMLELAAVRRWMLVTWNKPNPTPLCNGNYLPDTEYIVHSFPSGGLHGEYRDRARFIVYPAQQGNMHPNEKPLPVMIKCVKCASEAGDTVADLFMGSGSTGVACIRTGRKFIGIEVDKERFETARDRLTRELEQGRFDFSTPEPAPAIRQADML
jgi:site-specific DNA-methyltransferase (adenine-specific)